MLVLVAGSDLDYLARVGETLQRASHEVVHAATLDVCRSFAAKGSADAVVLATSQGEEIPVDLLEQVRGTRGTPVMLLLDDASPANTSPYMLAGAECAPKPRDPEYVARWLQLAMH